VREKRREVEKMNVGHVKERRKGGREGGREGRRVYLADLHVGRKRVRKGGREGRKGGKEE